MIVVNRTIVASMICLVLLTACSFFYSPLEVIRWSPGSDAPVDPETAKISVVFNHSPNMVVTEEAFSISCRDEEIPGRISWEDTTLLFNPYENLPVNSEFTIRIDISAEENNGSSLGENFTVSFRTGVKGKRPAITAIIPGDGAVINDRYKNILINFDQVMDFDSLLSGFSISPDIKGISNMDPTGKIFTFTPVEAFELQEEYTVNLSAKTSSLNGYQLADEYEFCFSISDDKIPPEIIKASSEDYLIELSDSLVNTGWEKDDAVRLSFTEEINLESIETSVAIEPATPFDISLDETTTPSDIIINFNENLEWQILYNLIISTAVKDLAGNKMEEEETYKLFINGGSSSPPLLSRANFIPGNETICFFDSETPETAIDSHQILDTSEGDADQNPLYFDFYFNLADGAILPFFEFTDNFLISPENTCITLDYLNFQIFNPGESTASASDPEPTPSAKQAVLRLITAVNDSQTSSGNIIFRVYSDLTDSLGNSMSNDWSRELFDEDN